MLRTHPSRTRDELIQALAGPVGEALAGTGSRYVVYPPVDEPYNAPEASFDAVATLWLGREGSGVVKDATASPHWAAADLALAGIASGTTILAATTVEVV